MELVSPSIAKALAGASLIRQMFEAGMELKKQYGEENVYDFSLGNPDLPPPKPVIEAMGKLATELDNPGSLGYMPNPGYPSARKALAAWLTKQQGVEISWNDLIITVGAAGAINCLFHTILAPGDEVLCPAPYFVEYGFYAGNHGGILKPVPSQKDTFKLDIEGIAAAINEKTRALIINSPNNPSGVIYSEDEIRKLGQVLAAATEKYGRPIYLVADEPYRFLAFDGKTVPSVFQCYKYSVIVSSFSKNLGLAGERVGYAAVNPAIDGREQIIGGLIVSNRTLGFVNAPCIGQKLMEACLTAEPNTAVYEERRALMAQVLDKAGIEYQMPAGTFYFFPKVPGGSMDDKAFSAKLFEQRVLAVPGSAFGFPGYIRLALCCDKRYIINAADGFARAVEAFLK